MSADSETLSTPLDDGHTITPSATMNDPPPTLVPQAISDSAQEVTDTPPRRGPGRPKGSGKKVFVANEASPAEPRIKRPVGRPRKDGLPAGSLATTNKDRKPPGRPRKSAPGDLGGNIQSSMSQFRQQPFGAGVAYGVPVQGYFPQQQATDSRPPPWQAMYTSLGEPAKNNTVPPMASLQGDLIGPIDPALEKEDWAMLSRSKPNTFMRVLLAALAAATPPTTAGPSVEDAFRSHLVSLTPKDAGAGEIPSLYSIMKTFWLPSSPAYFSLTASASTARIPSEHRFLYWDPQPLIFNGISCPVCAAPLTNHGRIASGPMKVYDLGAPFFIIGCEYACRSATCTEGSAGSPRTFASTDARILRALPVLLRSEFPAHLLRGAPDAGGDLGVGPTVWNWQGLGVSTALHRMVRGCLQAGLGRDAILGIVHSVQHGAAADAWAMQEEDEDEEDGQEDDQDVDHEEEKGAPPLAPAPAPTPTHDVPGSYFSAWRASAPGVDPAVVNGHGGTLQQYPYPPPGPYGTYPAYYNGGWYQPAPGTALAPPTSAPATLKRTLDGTVAGDGAPIKRVRHCCKCGSQDCKGKGGRAFCTNVCQDCGERTCQGRNSKRPDKTCRDAWP